MAARPRAGVRGADGAGRDAAGWGAGRGRIKLAASGPVEKGTWASAADGVALDEGAEGDGADGAGGDGQEDGGGDSGGSGEEREARRAVTAKLVSLVHRWGHTCEGKK